MPQGQASHKHHQGIYVMPEYCVQWHTLTLTFVHLPVITLLISSAFVYPVKQAHCARVGYICHLSTGYQTLFDPEHCFRGSPCCLEQDEQHSTSNYGPSGAQAPCGLHIPLFI
jgi:hypothetical protein